ncbi:MAG: tetratricopeptide repeat protein [Candidatus Obscuribacter sp.]|nr:tetratricopeptide repeat protein [Candidatus Melainabacteria bacterium]MDX1989685.1 tetratricopeptide repeat protein [Candidatus Obscuribacter sp.]
MKYPRKLPALFLLVLMSSGTVLLESAPTQLSPAYGKTSSKNTKDPSEKNARLGKQLYEKGDYDGAIDALLQATYFARNGYAPEAFYYLGMTYKAKGQDQKALDALSRHVEQALDKAGPGHLALAQVYTRMKNYQKAREEIMKAFSATDYRDPLFRQIHLAAGVNEDTAGHYRAALDSYREALGNNKRDWDLYEAWIRYAECLMKLKEWVLAYQTLMDMTTTKNPLVGIHYDRVHLDIGLCLLTKGNHQGAIENWHRALEYEPRNREVHLQLAMLLESERHLSSALKEYKQFVASCGEEDRERVNQVERRIAVIEHKLAAESEAPAPTNPTPYMRDQEQKTVDARIREEQERLRNMPTDPGF